MSEIFDEPAQEPGEDGDGDLNERQREILRLVTDQGFVTIEALARIFTVSAQTVRRDIIRLDGLGLLQRFHGGAGQRESPIRLGYVEKQTVLPDAKARIGRAAAALLPSGSSVFLDVGTTVEAVARALVGRRRMHVVTPSLPAAAILAGSEIGDVVVTGGLVRGPDGSLVGEDAVAVIRRFSLDAAVIACSAFDERDGSISDFDVLKVSVKQAMMARSRQTILVADASKFARSAVIRITDFGGVSHLVTDALPPPRLQRLIEEAGCRIIVAPLDA